MATVSFTRNLARHVDCPEAASPGATVREVLDGVFVLNPRLRGYVLDEQGRLRKHVEVWVDGQPIVDRIGLADPVGPSSRLHVLQLLSGG